MHDACFISSLGAPSTSMQGVLGVSRAALETHGTSFSASVLTGGPRANSKLVSRPPDSVCLITQLGIQGAVGPKEGGLSDTEPYQQAPTVRCHNRVREMAW